MPMTSNATAQACSKVEIQPGCTGSWYDIGGEATTVTLPEEVVNTGMMYVFNDDRAITTHGKKQPFTAVVSGAFTNGTTEAFNLVRAIWQTAGCDRKMCLRVTPEGGNIGDLEIYVGDLLTGLKPPDVDAGSGDPSAFSFSVYGNYDYDTKAS